MAELKNFIRTDLGDGYVVCEDVNLPSGSVCTVYFSPSNIYVLSCGEMPPNEQHRQMYELLDTRSFRLYIQDCGDGVSGLYNDFADTVGQPFTDDELTEDVNTWLDSGPPIYKPFVIERMISRLKKADIQARGYAVDENGEIFLLRHGTLKKASPCSSDWQYFLTLFGGTLGVHKLALGKPMAGLFYLCTGGLFLAGWLFDLLQLFLGTTKDSRKRYLFPLQKRWLKLLLLPFGLAVGFTLFLAYLKVTDILGLGVQSVMSNFGRSINPYAFQRFLETVSNSSPR